MKMSKTLSAKYYQENKNNERLQKQARKRHQNLPKEEKEKSSTMVRTVTRISQRTKNNSLLRTEKILQHEEQRFIIIIRKNYYKQ